MAAAPMMGEKVDVPALGAKESEIASRGFRTGNDHEGAIAGNRLAGPNDCEIDLTFEFQRVEIVEIGNTREPKKIDLALARLACVAKPQRVFGWKFARAEEKRQHAEAGPTGSLFDQAIAVVEQRNIATELVDDESLDHGGIIRIEHGLDADKLRDDSAPVDVADQHDRHVGFPRKAHIGDIAFAKVHLGGTAGALD